MITVCEKCEDDIRVHNLYGCCGEPNSSTARCGNDYSRCYDCSEVERWGTREQVARELLGKDSV